MILGRMLVSWEMDQVVMAFVSVLGWKLVYCVRQYRNGRSYVYLFTC